MTAGEKGAAHAAHDGELCVTNVQRFSLHDGGGIRTVVFVKGCPFRCPWCCNPETLDAAPQVQFTERLCIRCSPHGADGRCASPCAACPTGAKRMVGEWRSVASLVEEVVRDAAFYEESDGGMTLSGGECLATPRAQRLARELLAACRAAGVSTAVETTLAVPLEDADGLAAATGEFLVDFKIADRARSLEVCGIDPAVRDENVRRLVALGARVVARLPIIPGYTDAADNVAANAARLVELGVGRADVLPFHQLGESKYEQVGRDYAMAGVPQLSDADVADAVAALEAAGLDVVVHGE